MFYSIFKITSFTSFLTSILVFITAIILSFIYLYRLIMIRLFKIGDKYIYVTIPLHSMLDILNGLEYDHIIQYIPITLNPIKLEKYEGININSENLGFNDQGYRYSEEILNLTNINEFTIEELSSFCDYNTWIFSEDRYNVLKLCETIKYNNLTLLQLGNLSYMYLYDYDKNIQKQCENLLEPLLDLPQD